MVATQKVSQGPEEAWNNLYAGYVQGVATTLVLQTLLEDEQRAKCESIVDGPLVLKSTVNSYSISQHILTKCKYRAYN